MTEKNMPDNQNNDQKPSGISPGVESPSFDEWIAERIYPSVYKIANGSIVIYLAFVIIDLLVGGWNSTFIQSIPYRIVALAFLILMAVSSGKLFPYKYRGILTILFGLISELTMIYFNVFIIDDIANVNLIVLFFLFGSLLIGSAIGFRIYTGNVIVGLSAIAVLLALGHRTMSEFLHVGIVIIPAVIFIGYIIIIQRRDSQELWALEKVIHFQSSMDSLCHILNRRKWYELSSQVLIGIYSRTSMNHEASLLILDIDHFKHVNDTWGHECGDIVLKHISDTLRSETRRSDLVGRLGGEEFGILLVGSSPSEAYAIAERIRSKIEDLEVKYRDETIKVTTSIGLVHCNTIDLDDLFREADKCLYLAKREGRNRVIVSAS